MPSHNQPQGLKQSAPVTVNRHGNHVALVTITRASSANSIDISTATALGDAFDALEDDDSVHCVVLTGEGQRVFCAGADLKKIYDTRQLSPSDPRRAANGFAGIAARRRTTPLIAAVNGHAFGGGCEIALAADLIVASNEASFALPETSLGLFAAGGGALRLPTVIPRHKAMEMLLLAEPRPARWLADAGMVNAIVPPGNVLDTALDWADKIASRYRNAVVETMKCANNGLVSEKAWQENDHAFELLINSPHRHGRSPSLPQPTNCLMK